MFVIEKYVHTHIRESKTYWLETETNREWITNKSDATFYDNRPIANNKLTSLGFKNQWFVEFSVKPAK